MDNRQIIDNLARNRSVFDALLSKTNSESACWKASPDQWSLLEVVCHLYDEEREDFRARVKHCLENPELPFLSIDPVGWVTTRKYLAQDFNEKLLSFLKERNDSIEWLRSLENPNWENIHENPKLGVMSANKFLSNWLAHDHIHIRQINRIKYEFLDSKSKDSLKYAGDW